MNSRFATLLCVGVGLAIGPVRADDVKKEQDRLKGTWELAGLVVDGTDKPKKFVEDHPFTLIFAGNEATYIAENNMINGNRRPRKSRVSFRSKLNIKLDPGKKPKTIDFIYLDEETKGNTAFGLYEVDGDSLKVCLSVSPNGPRPDKLESKKDTKTLVFILRRVKP
jgi:uncharacterized protein (TIGR03067 family)